MNRKTSLIFLVFLGLWAIGSILPAFRSRGISPILDNSLHAQSTPFYEGKTVRIILGAGGGYDFWARLLARHMPKYIPGNPNFVVQNMFGAGSVIASNYVYNIAKPDGLTVGMPNQALYMGEFVGNKEAKFQMRKFLWIGSPDRNPSILYIRADTPFRSVEDVRKAQIPPKCGATGWDTSSIIPASEETLGAKFDLVVGYQEANQVDLAVERGEVVCRMLGLTAHFSREPFLTWHTKGFDRHLLQTGRKRDGRAADIPTVYELMNQYKTAEINRRAVDVLTAGEDFGHPMMAPPGTPSELVKILRDAYAKALRDPELLAQAKKGQWVVEHVPGEELQALAERIMNQPPEVVQRIKKLTRMNQ